MSAATRRLPGLAQRQLTRSTNPHFSCVAPRLAPRVAPPSAARIQYRYVTTTVPSDKPSVPNPTDPSSPEPEVSQGTAAPASEKLKEGASQDPELYVLSVVLLFAFGIAGFYFGRKPTSASSQANVAIADGTMPWEVEDAEDGQEPFKYRYHPGGDKSKPLKNAPSALNVVIVPAVTLPKHLHDKFNKWGKDLY